VAAVAAVALAGGTWWWSVQGEGPPGGTPRLVLDRDVIDFGNVRFGTPVEAVFALSNAGDGILRLSEVPRVIVVDGC
jgi:hypothetical protein